MPVVLTGDVHHAIPSADRAHTTESESRLAVAYARIAERHGLRVTLFVTGRAAVTDGEDLRPILSMEHVEIGGHGWDAFYPRRLYAALRRLSGSPHGPSAFQRLWTIRRTCRTLSRATGRPVRSWRNHAYQHDANTATLLAAAGVEVWSDAVDLARSGPYRHGSGVTVLPMNTYTDHEHVFHGDLTPAMVGAGVSPERDVFEIAEWCDRVCRQVEEIVERGGTATILAHPMCMKVADDFASFERLCAFLAGFPSEFAADSAARLEV